MNAHLLYGDKSKSREERKMEFDALVDWLRWRTRSGNRLYHTNMIAFGDMNLEFDERFAGQDEADQAIKEMNKNVGRGYSVNFPFLDTPGKRQDAPLGNGNGRFNSTARMTQTYDQIGFFGKGKALPLHDENEAAGRLGVNAFDYGVFAFADLFARALHDVDGFKQLPTKKSFVKRFEHDVSDHHPIWVRLAKPGPG